MKAILFDQFGEPGKVLRLGDKPIPTPGRNEVRVRMLASPINPSDLMTVRGVYGRLPDLPATPGFEGVGVVDALGPGMMPWLRGLRVGRRVAVLNSGGGNWQEHVVVPFRQAVPVPDDVAEEQVASFFVNPATVLAMVGKVLNVQRGDWLAQSAGGSSLARMVIRLGKSRGFRTINLVRRDSWIPELKKLGADHVLVEGKDNIPERIREITGGGVLHALDCVGGETALNLVRSLGKKGKLLLYGTLSDEPIRLEPRLLMGPQASVEGFWLSEWVKDQGIFTMLGLFREILREMRAGVFHTPVAATYPLEQISEAVTHAAQPGRDGKILLRIGSK